MIDKPATHEADNTTFDTTVDALDNVGTESVKADSPRSAGARFALFIAILALFFTVIGIAAGYKHWQRMNDRARANAADIAALRQQLQAVPASDALDTLRKDLEAKTAQTLTANDQVVQEMARIQNQTRQFADTVASQVEQVTFLQAKMQQSATPASASEWQIAEVEFLLHLANRQLHLAQDVRTADNCPERSGCVAGKSWVGELLAGTSADCTGYFHAGSCVSPGYCRYFPTYHCADAELEALACIEYPSCLRVEPVALAKRRCGSSKAIPCGLITSVKWRMRLIRPL